MDSFFDRKIDHLFGEKKINKTASGNSDYLQFQKRIIELNDCLPLDVYFRTQYTKEGYMLYLFSLPRMMSVTLNVNLNSKTVYKSDGTYACAAEDIVPFLERNEISTLATQDDIAFVAETEGGSDE